MQVCLSMYDLLVDTMACNFIKKETQIQLFSCEFCKIFKNTFPYSTIPAAPSVVYQSRKFLFKRMYRDDEQPTLKKAK